MVSTNLESIVRRLVTQLASGEFDRTVAECSASRLTASDLRQVIKDYGRTLVAPPVDAYAELDTVAVRNAGLPTWSVRAPLWSKEEGRSDLTVELTIAQDGERWNVELDDLHVL
jgi:hypothetical protein